MCYNKIRCVVFQHCNHFVNNMNRNRTLGPLDNKVHVYTAQSDLEVWSRDGPG